MEQKLFLIKVLSILLAFLLFACITKKRNNKLTGYVTIYYLPGLYLTSAQIREDIKYNRHVNKVVLEDKAFIDSIKLLLSETIMQDSLYYPSWFSAKILIEMDNTAPIFMCSGGIILYQQNYYRSSNPRIRKYFIEKFPEIWYFPHRNPEGFRENLKLIEIDTIHIKEPH
jgi:hypothetical protein